MAMTKCRECGAEISTAAAACLKCGAKHKKQTSGCLLVALGLLALVVVVSMFGSGSHLPSHPNPTDADAATPVPPPKDPAAKIAEETNALAEIEQRAKTNAATLKKFYATTEQVKQAQDDVLRLAIIKGLYANAKAKDEKALSQRAERLLPQVEQQARELYASTVAQIFIKSGMDVRVTATGTEKKTLRLAYVLMSQPIVYDFQNNVKLDEQAKGLGFLKLVYTDGFNASWTVDLK
jgi:hypothetical protein